MVLGEGREGGTRRHTRLRVPQEGSVGDWVGEREGGDQGRRARQALWRVLHRFVLSLSLCVPLTLTSFSEGVCRGSDS